MRGEDEEIKQHIVNGKTEIKTKQKTNLIYKTISVNFLKN